MPGTHSETHICSRANNLSWPKSDSILPWHDVHWFADCEHEKHTGLHLKQAFSTLKVLCGHSLKQAPSIIISPSAHIEQKRELRPHFEHPSAKHSSFCFSHKSSSKKSFVEFPLLLPVLFDSEGFGAKMHVFSL